MPYLYCQEHGGKRLVEFKQRPLSGFEGEAVLVFHGSSREQYLCDSCNGTLNEGDYIYLIICLPRDLAEVLDTDMVDHDEYAQEYIKNPMRDVFGIEGEFPDVVFFDKPSENSSESQEARQFEVTTTGWQHGNLIVGWDPAIGTYYGQILDSNSGELGPLLWLTPMGDEKNIQTVDGLEKYINYRIKKRWNDDSNWPPIKLNKLLRLNLERDRLATGGYWSEIPAHTNLGIKPPSVSSSGYVVTYDPESSNEQNIEDLKDWFLDNYESPAVYANAESQYLDLYGRSYNAQRELVKYWGEEYPIDVLDAAGRAIEDETGTLNWAPARWRIEHLIESPASTKQYNEVLKGLSELEFLLNQVKQPIGIGHNRPH